VVRLAGDGETWNLVDGITPVHLAAFFRDPGIDNERPVEVVLDLHLGKDGHLRAGSRCWVRRFLQALQGLPPGITVALDNGVRCRTPQKEYCFMVYQERAKHCHRRSDQWFSTLRHPDGGSPGIAICDKDLACSLAQLGLLQTLSGEAWRMPKRFVDAVGDEVTYLGVASIILAHPAVFQYHSVQYHQAFADKGIVSSLAHLARMDG
jgi:hypothetical protein